MKRGRVTTYPRLVVLVTTLRVSLHTLQKKIYVMWSRVITFNVWIKCVPGRGKRIKSVYRVAERAHILCTASWSQVAKCVPIHSLNITTFGWYFITVLVNSVAVWLPKPKHELWVDTNSDICLCDQVFWAYFTSTRGVYGNVSVTRLGIIFPSGTKFWYLSIRPSILSLYHFYKRCVWKCDKTGNIYKWY